MKNNYVQRTKHGFTANFLSLNIEKFEPLNKIRMSIQFARFVHVWTKAPFTVKITYIALTCSTWIDTTCER